MEARGFDVALTLGKRPSVESGLPPRKKRGKLNNLKCSFCREDKKACSPAERSWLELGEKCEYCESKSLPCSEPTKSKQGRPPKSRPPPSEPISDPLLPTPITEGTAEISKDQQEYCDWINRLSYGQMLSTALDTLKRMRSQLISLFDKEKIFWDGFWDTLPGLQDYREFESFVEYYHRQMRLMIPPAFPPGFANFQGLPSALVALTAHPATTFLDDPKIRREHVTILTSYKLFGPAMKMQVEVLRQLQQQDDELERDLEKLITLKDDFSIWAERIIKQQDNVHVPRMTLENPALFPVGFELYIMKALEDAGWNLDCLGRSIIQAHENEPNFQFDQWRARGYIRNSHDILRRTHVHTLCDALSEGDCALSDLINKDLFKAEAAKELNIKNSLGQQALHYTAATGNILFTKHLLSLDGIQVDSPDFLGRTPTFYAAQNGHLGILKLLLKHEDINIDRTDGKGRTSFYEAVRNSNFGCVKYLLEKGANPNLRNNDIIPRTPFALACASQDIDMLQLLGSHKDFDIGIKNTPYGNTPLLVAMERDFLEGFQYLAGRGDVYPAISTNRMIDHASYLCWAVKYNAVNIVKYISEYPGVDVNLGNGLCTPLWRAVTLNRHTELVDFLLEHPDIDVDAECMGRTPLMVAISDEQSDIVSSLLSHKNINLATKNTSGKTAMDLAVDLPPRSPERSKIIQMLRDKMSEQEKEVADTESWTGSESEASTPTEIRTLDLGASEELYGL